MTEEQYYLAIRIDKVRSHLENQSVRLNQWAIDYWTTVLAQLERKWKLYSVREDFPTTTEIIQTYKAYQKNIIAPREKSYDD